MYSRIVQAVRIAGFHPADPGSNPGAGKCKAGAVPLVISFCNYRPMSAHPCLVAADVFLDLALVALLMAAALVCYDWWQRRRDAAYEAVPPREMVL